MIKSIQPYGSWASSLTPELLSKKELRYGHMSLDQGNLYWLETRSSEKGRGVIVCATPDGKRYEVLPKHISVRTKVHEYGGADFAVFADKLYFSNAEDNRVYLFDGRFDARSDTNLTALTSIDPGKEYRYADFCLDSTGEHLICVREIHLRNQRQISIKNNAENKLINKTVINGTVINEMISISLVTKKVTVIHSGFDFYASPKLSTQGSRICWICWNQPDMPWTAAELWLADYHNDGQIDAAHRVNGGNGDAIFQPEWSKEDQLHYISDQSGWSNIYCHTNGLLHALTPIDRDFGIPQWLLGMGTYVINSDESLYALNFEHGQQQLCHIDPNTGHIEPIALPFKSFGNLLLGDENYLYFCASAPALEATIYRYDIQDKSYQKLTDASDFSLQAGEISLAQAISFESTNQRICHGFYYPPTNTQYEGLPDEKPPLIVISHGGPTALSSNSLDPNIQFWTHRGFAVVDVNYAGSTGYGKAYRNLLNGQWGIVDVEDCIAAANYLVEKNLADKNRLLIRGGSAGGYTTLCALTFHDVFAAGMSRYGVADLEALAAESHKFEARYLDIVVGPYPQEKELYQARSPIHHTEQLSCPILLLQGEDDKVVPPSQAELMVKALEKKEIPYAYLLFPGEGHGFRKAETIIKAFNAELSFYRQVLKIESEEKIESLEIKYL